MSVGAPLTSRCPEADDQSSHPQCVPAGGTWKPCATIERSSVIGPIRWQKMLALKVSPRSRVAHARPRGPGSVRAAGDPAQSHHEPSVAGAAARARRTRSPGPPPRSGPRGDLQEAWGGAAGRAGPGRGERPRRASPGRASRGRRPEPRPVPRLPRCAPVPPAPPLSAAGARGAGGRRAPRGGKEGASGRPVRRPALPSAPPSPRPPRCAPPSPRPTAPGGQSQRRARDERCLR